jgi:sugar phosphate isomerase/epimerase
MKFSFMSFSCPELSLEALLDLAKQLGYDGVEPRVECKHGHGIELGLAAVGRAAARALAAEKGVAFSCVATSCIYADPQKRVQMIDDTRRYIDLAADIGAARIRVFGGVIPAGITREQAIDGVACALTAVAPHAASRGVTVCLETHDHWCDPADVAAVMTRVGHPAIQVNWDIMHPVRVAHVTMQEAFMALKPWIRHVHFHDGVTTDGKLIMVPIGQGEIDHATAVRLLKAAHWDGYLSGEWIAWEPYAEHLPRELAVMKGYGA